MKKNHYSFQARIKHYPFNLAAQIQFVSFPGGIDTSVFQTRMNLDSLPRSNDTVCYAGLIEVKNLLYTQVDKLTDIFYNYGYRGPTYIGTLPSCYHPRNAILFLDNFGHAFEYIEICFECREVKTSANNISLGEMCEQKMDMLKELFRAAGIEYGILKGLASE